MKRSFFVLLLLLFTLPVFAENTILIVGDSISAGYGIESDQGWVALLRKRLQTENYNYRVINASISGDTTSNGLVRLPNALAEYKPSITVIELGGNDGLRGILIKVIKNNLEEMVALAQAAGSKVILLGLRLPPNYGPTYIQQFQEIYTSIAASKNIQVAPLFLQHVDDQPEKMQPDGIHPRANAQGILLENVWPILVTLLNK